MRSRALYKVYIIASSALLAAIAVYCFARSQPPALFPQPGSMLGLATLDGELFGSAPSFFYTLALGLFIGLAAPSAKAARSSCLMWIVLSLCLELSQLPVLSYALVEWLQAPVPGWAWDLVGPYWTRGVFDPFDLLATLVGGFIAMNILCGFSGGIKNEFIG